MKIDQVALKRIIAEELSRARVLRESKFDEVFESLSWYDGLWDFFQKVKDVLSPYDDVFQIDLYHETSTPSKTLSVSSAPDQSVRTVLSMFESTLEKNPDPALSNHLVVDVKPRKEFQELDQRGQSNKSVITLILALSPDDFFGTWEIEVAYQTYHEKHSFLMINDLGVSSFEEAVDVVDENILKGFDL